MIQFLETIPRGTTTLTFPLIRLRIVVRLLLMLGKPTLARTSLTSVEQQFAGFGAKVFPLDPKSHPKNTRKRRHCILGVCFLPVIKAASIMVLVSYSKVRFPSRLDHIGAEIVFMLAWANVITFPPKLLPPVTSGFDPIIGLHQGKPRNTYDPKAEGGDLKLPFNFVVPKGGEYFFSPSIQTLRDVFALKT
jgi:hypothetical protein